MSMQWAEIVTATMSAHEMNSTNRGQESLVVLTVPMLGLLESPTSSLSACNRNSAIFTSEGMPNFTNGGMHNMHATEGKILLQERSSSFLVCQVLHFPSSVDPEACHGEHGVSSTTVLSNHCSHRCP